MLTTVPAYEFAKTHAVDQDWVAAMGDRIVPVFVRGQSGRLNGNFSATVSRHYRNGMWEFVTPGGMICAPFSAFVAD